MLRPRVLLCESDAALTSVLLQLFKYEQIDVMCCASFDEIQAATCQFPDAIVVSDSWSNSSPARLTVHERDQIVALGRKTTLILTTGRDWAKDAVALSLGERVVVVQKPYDIDDLIAAIRAAAEQPTQHPA